MQLCTVHGKTANWLGCAQPSKTPANGFLYTLITMQAIACLLVGVLVGRARLLVSQRGTAEPQTAKLADLRLGLWLPASCLQYADCSSRLLLQLCIRCEKRDAGIGAIAGHDVRDIAYSSVQ